MSASEATYWLREFFGESLEPIQAHRFGSHTCKTTLLTWAGRCVTVAFSPTERRLLGHHLEPNMKSILTYSRESYTALYSKVLMMFRCMRSGEYDPDLPAIDRVVQLSDVSNQTQMQTNLLMLRTIQILSPVLRQTVDRQVKRCTGQW